MGPKEHAVILTQGTKGSSSNDRQKESWKFLVIYRQTGIREVSAVMRLRRPYASNLVPVCNSA